MIFSTLFCEAYWLSLEIINNYVAPEYKPMLREYLSLCKKAHTQLNLALAFGMHRQFAKTGSMLDTKWEKFL